MDNKTGKIWQLATSQLEADRWKARFERKGALSVECKPREHKKLTIIDVFITLNRDDAKKVLGYKPAEAEWMDEEGSGDAI